MIDITLPHKEEYKKKGITLTVVPKTPKDYCMVKLRAIYPVYNMLKWMLFFKYTDMPNSVDEFTYYIKGDYRVDTDAMLKQWARRYKITYGSGNVTTFNCADNT